MCSRLIWPLLFFVKKIKPRENTLDLFLIKLDMPYQIDGRQHISSFCSSVCERPFSRN